MKLINQSYKIIKQEPGLDGIYKAIEQAGRTCYKSEDKITDTSAKEFVDRMVKSGHHAMLEFGTVYLSFPLLEDWHPDNTDWGKYAHNKYSYLKEYDKPLGSDVYESRQLVTTNYRTLVEHGWLDDLKYLCEPTEYHEKRVCVKFVTDRGVANELVRHRTFSFSQESSRYCNYSKDKFDNGLTFIIPTWSNLGPADHDEVTAQFDVYQTADTDLLCSMMNAEFYYLSMVNKDNLKPQEARQVLPLSTKTEINMCGFVSDWKHFFDLRDDSHAHPDMQALVKPLHQEFIKNIE